MRPVKTVDLHSQYLSMKEEIDGAIQRVLTSTDFIQGEAVREFEHSLSVFMGGTEVIACGNGTDALQIAMMSLNFKPGDEIILPVFTYVATAEVIALLRLNPVFVDVDENSFTIDVSQIERLITDKTVAIVPVHLFGQCAEMEPLMELAKKFKLHIIEDAAQSLGANYTFRNGRKAKVGTLGKVNITSFFPTKNLGAFGDGGAIFTNDKILAEEIRMVANHGQKRKYYHDRIGVNSRLDTLQAAILSIKLKRLDEFEKKRRAVGDFYDRNLSSIPFIKIPTRMNYSSHVFHQYTLVTRGVDRDRLKVYLLEKGIPTTIFYPLPLHLQNAYRKPGFDKGSFPVAEKLSEQVLSLPMHTELDQEQLSYICDSIRNFS